MDWEVRSLRVSRSHWWKTVNRSIVQGALTAWYRFDTTTTYGYVSSYDNSYLWYLYAKSKLFDPAGGTYPLGYYGGTWKQVWAAHQRSLWNGIAKAAPYLANESKAEQLFIQKVVSNVEVYYRGGIELDTFLDKLRVAGGYPETYPATIAQACNATWPPNVWIIGPFVQYRSELEDAICRSGAGGGF